MRNPANPLGDGANYEQETKAIVREIDKFEFGTPARVVEIFEPRVVPKQWSECDKEIPILLLNQGEHSIIMTTNKPQTVIDWSQYKKVSEMIVTTPYGYNRTLEEVLADVSRFTEIKGRNAPKIERPIPTMIQGGLFVANIKGDIDKNERPNESKIHEQFRAIAEPLKAEPIEWNINSHDNRRRNCNTCDGNMNRAKFPIYVPIARRL